MKKLVVILSLVISSASHALECNGQPASQKLTPILEKACSASCAWMNDPSESWTAILFSDGEMGQLIKQSGMGADLDGGLHSLELKLKVNCLQAEVFGEARSESSKINKKAKTPSERYLFSESSHQFSVSENVKAQLDSEANRVVIEFAAVEFDYPLHYMKTKKQKAMLKEIGIREGKIPADQEKVQMNVSYEIELDDLYASYSTPAVLKNAKVRQVVEVTNDTLAAKVLRSNGSSNLFEGSQVTFPSEKMVEEVAVQEDGTRVFSRKYRLGLAEFLESIETKSDDLAQLFEAIK